MKYHLGVDVGSVSTNIVVLDDAAEVVEALYLRAHGDPLGSVRSGLERAAAALPAGATVSSAGVTGSARHLIGAMVDADVVKNEITAHAVAATHFHPDAATVIEIGGQDSKIILLRNGIVADFAMNNVCAAGTGSFLDQQATRLGIPIEDFGRRALESRTEVRIAGRCTVFAESDMVHKQQLGCAVNDILRGLCSALVRNYFSSVGKGKEIRQPVVFQGGVAANAGIRRAFAEHLGKEPVVPKHFGVMGAVGAAILAKDHVAKTGGATRFKGFGIARSDFRTGSVECRDCPNACEVVVFRQDGRVIAMFGDRCGKHADAKASAASRLTGDPGGVE
ncbi:MAG: acyl-CoA dehydratase activase [Thermodesulfobacteriota bacterium]